jgi:AhpD family alkylhydroperoxidase
MMADDFLRRSDLALVTRFAALAPPEARGFLAFNHSAERQDGAIPPRFRELIAVAVALTTQCPYCIDVHVKAATAAGVSQTELAEAAFVAAAVRAGGTLSHALMALRLSDPAAG